MNHQKGTMMAEILVVLPLLILLLFGILEAGLIYRAKFSLNQATAMVVRAGALNNACMGAMEQQLHRSLAPLFDRKSDSVTDYHYNKAMNGNRIRIYSDIDLIYPTDEVFNKFSQSLRLYPQDLSTCARNAYGIKPFFLASVIPNDNLANRDDVIKSVEHQGKSINLSLQQANQLNIRVRLCHRLYFPVIDLILDHLMRGNHRVNSIFHNNCINGAATDLGMNQRGRYLVLESRATLPMQTPFLKQALKDH